MNELELYVDSLDPNLSNEEKVRLVKKWKKDNNWSGNQVEVSEQVEFEEVDLGVVKKQDGVPGAVAPSMGPQEAPQPVTEFGLEDTFSVSPQVDQDVTSDTVEEKKDGDWDFWQETGTKIKAATVDALGKLSRVPTFLNEIQAAISREFMTDEEKARYDALDPLTKQVLANISPQPGLTDLANTGLQNYEESVKKAEKIREDLTQFETTIGEEYAKGNFVEATVRTASDALGSLPSVVQSMIPYVGIASIFAGEAAGASAEAQKEGEELSLKTIGYSTVKGASEALLEVTTKKIGGQMFKNLSGKGANEVKKSLTQVMLGIGKDYGAEGLSESATETINRMADAVILGKKDAFDNYFKEVIDVFLVGGAMGGGMSTTGAGGKIIRNTLEDNSVKNDLNKTQYKNLTDAYESPDLTEGLSELTENRFTKKKLDAELNEKVGQGVFTVEKSNEIKNNFREIQGALNTIKPLSISTKNKAPIVNLVVEQKKLKQEIKSIDNPSLTKEQSERLSEIDKQLGDLITKDKAEKIDIGAKKIAEEIGVGFESFETQEDVDSAIETLKEEGGEIDTKNSDNYGTFVVLPDGRRIIVLNKEVATEDRTFTEGQHETGHAVLYETVKNKPEAAIALGKSLLNELQTNKNITIKPEFQARLDQYVEDANISEADTMEEVLTLTSEALTEGAIEINETIGDKIGGFIRRALSAMGMKVKFKNGKDVLNFIKDYNRSVYRQQGLSRGLKKAAVEGVEVDITPQEVTDLKQSVAKESKRVEDSQEVQRLYDEQGVSAAMDIINKFKPITNRIVESRSQAPNFDRQLLTDEIETGPRGILDLIMEYKPESGVPLAAYINKFLPARAIEASRRVLGEEFTTDVTEAKGVVAEEVAETVTKEKPIAKKPTETVEFSQAQIEKIGAKDKAEVETRITEATNEAFKGQDIKTFGQTRNVPKSVADIYAGMFGLNPQTITDKTRNYQKTDAEGLTTAKQFLLKNANNDFARLPETKDGFGKGTFLPRNVMNALYTDGKLTGTLKDYMDLIRQKPTKPIYRDAVGQTIRGLLNLHIRNRMFESLVPTTAERAVGGAKFSKRKAKVSDNEIMQVFGRAQRTKVGDISKRNNQQPLVRTKNKWKLTDEQRRYLPTFVETIAESFGRDFFTLGSFAFSSRSLLGNKTNLENILSNAKFKENAPIAPKRTEYKIKSTAKTKKEGTVGFLDKGFIDKIKTSEFKKNEAAKMPYLKYIFKQIEADLAKNPQHLPYWEAVLNDAQNSQNHFMRFLAPITFYPVNKNGEPVFNEVVVEEHTMPQSNVAAFLLESAINGSVDQNFGFIEENYFQGALRESDDKKTKIPGKYNYTSSMGESFDSSNNPTSWLRYINKNVNQNNGGIDLTLYKTIDGNIVANEILGFKTPQKYSGNPNLSNIIQQKIIDKIENPEYNAEDYIENYLKIIDQETNAAVVNNNLQPNNIKLEGNNAKFSKAVVNELGNLDSSLNQARRPDAPVKKIRVFDFDDTLARSKSQVLYTVPNVEGGFSEGATKLKAIFMVGGPGAGKTNVGKGLQLGRRGYKVVNQDIALEAMKAEAGLPAKESDYTAEQRSLRSKLGAAARKAAVAKFDKYAAAGNGMVIDGTGASYNATTKKIKALQDLGYEVHMVVATTPLETAIERNKARAERSLPDFVVKKTYESVQESLKKYREDFGDRLYEINTETIEYGKPLPNDFLQKVYAGINANKVGKVDASNFATQYDVLESQGAEFDFREFSKVIEGKKGPLFSVAQKIAKARGTEDIFILTARPADAAKPIQEFMKVNGIDIPLQNITGLGDGTAAAKGRWIASKAAEGYNDFYFADDAVKNVEAVKEVLSQVDVKSKVQQAKASKRKTFDKVFNDIIEQKTGIESYKDYSAAKAKTVGANKGKFTFFTTPSAEDFLGLLYKTLGKGKVGDAQMAFYKENLLDPFNRAEMAISQAKVAAGRDYKALKKQFKGVPKTLEKETGISKYSYQHAIRTYIWDAQGVEVPGLSKRDQKRLTDFIKADPELQAFADQLVNIQKGKPYPKPDKDWTAGNITTDVISGINKVNRAEYLQEWQENVDIIFSEKNMNKLEAAFGAKYVEALKDSLRSMKSGSNRPLGGDRVSNAILDWLNNSVGAIMFLNTRSAVLQTISAVNFINWGDNNILKAGKAFANQKQFWGDFLTLMNSDYLLERRDGLKINVSESEIADAVEGSKNKVNAAISYLLNKGFVFTRYADSFAIASGGATFYRNRIESLVEQGMDRKLAEQQAFEDFRLIAEENQQSSSPMRISQQQRSLIGRIILQFGNTQLQYVRIQKRAVQDLVNKRGDWRANISKIVYYGAIQNIMFNALQSGLAWALFDEDEDDEQLTEANKEQKLERALNGAIDSQLKGLGIQGAVIAGVKNALITIAEQADKKSPKFEEALDDLLSIAPALGSKIRKLKSGARTVSWNRKEIKEKGFSMDNPAYLAGAQVISAIFNIPLDRAVMKINNMRNILNPATENWQKVALALGWSGWDVGLPYFGLAEDKPVLTETEKQVKKLFDLNKSDQVKMLLDLGLTKKEIRALTKEQQRVDEIIKLQNKNKDGK